MLRVSAPALCFHNPRDVAKRYSTLQRLEGIPANGKSLNGELISIKSTFKCIKAKWKNVMQQKSKCTPCKFLPLRLFSWSNQFPSRKFFTVIIPFHKFIFQIKWDLNDASCWFQIIYNQGLTLLFCSPPTVASGFPK